MCLNGRHSLLVMLVYPIHPIAPWAQRMPISLWDFIWRFYSRRYTLEHGFCFFRLLFIGCIGLTYTCTMHIHVIKCPVEE